MNDTNDKIIRELQKGELSIRGIARKFKVNVDRVRYYHYKLNRPDKFRARFVQKKLDYMRRKLSTAK